MDIPKKLKINTWEDLKLFFEDLLQRPINNVDDLEKWIHDRSKLTAIIDEDLAWRYIKMTCDTENKNLAEHYEYFVTKIQPEISKFNDILNRKLVNSKYFNDLSGKYSILKRSVERELELFRDENVPLFAELDKLEQEYARITGSMTINYGGKELTMQQAANYLKENDRKVREEVYRLMANRRLQAVDELNNLMSKLIELRNKAAENAGFYNYRDYKHQERERFDYTVDDVLEFDESIRQKVVPVLEKIVKHRKEALAYDILRPWDMAVDTSGKPPLKPFTDTKDFVEKTIKCFTEIRPQYGKYLREMSEKGLLDLESRKGKAPGGYNYPLMVSNVPFIFMNATQNIRDVETLVHEGGHAILSLIHI